MATEEQILQLEREWKSEGHSDEEIGKRIAALVAREDEEPEAETPEEEESEDTAKHPGVPSDEWPLCPVCAGNGRVPPELAESKEHVTCPDCNGLGQVRTGSIVPDYAILPCTRCNGNGWIYSNTLQDPSLPTTVTSERRF